MGSPPRNATSTGVVDALRSGKSCAVVKISYCDPMPRIAFEWEIRKAVPDVQLQYICFENDLQKANANCRRRRDGRDIQMLYAINGDVSASYTIPPGAD